MKRVLALLLAVAMVGGAIWARDRIDGDAPDGPVAGRGDDGRPVVVCTTELADPCAAVAAGGKVEVRVEDYWTTVQSLVDHDGEPPFDAWVAPAPLVELVEQERARRGRDPLLGQESPPIARSPLAMVVWNERLRPLAEHCGGEVTWTCVGESADVAWPSLGGQPTWGALKPGHPDPGTSAVGLLVTGQAAADWFGSAGFASNDFTQPGFRDWFAQLERSVADLAPGAGTPLDRLLSFGPAAFDLVATSEAEAAPRRERSRDRDRLSVLYPSPVTTVDVVLAPLQGAGGEGRVSEAFRSDAAVEALVASGWRVGDRTPPGAGDLELPADDGTPAGGVLLALRSLWQEVR